MLRGLSRTDDRGISVAIGVVLLVGIVTIVMAILATAVLGIDFLDRSPSADVVYEEDVDGTILIALADARGLSAGETEIRLQNVGDCATWDGSGTLGKGDTMILDGSDCPESLEQGDVLQLIGSNYLLDSYRIRNPVLDPDFDCDVDGDIEDADDTIVDADANDIDVKSGSDIKCDFGDGSGGRNFDLDSGSRLIGDISTADGDFLANNATVDGYVELLDEGEEMDIKDGSTIDGPIYGNGTIDIDGGSTVEGHVFGTSNIQLSSSDVTIEGNIYTLDESDVSPRHGEYDEIIELDDESELESEFENHK